ncbi:MAG: FMN-binding protein [Aestuariivirga sp.]
MPSTIDNLSQIQVAATAGRYRDGNFTGSAFDAYFGMVQVQANVQNGRLVSVDVLDYPNHQRTSRSINRQALPLLQSEVIRAQGTRVNIISGATLTSRAYLRSLKSALSRAGA